MEYKGNEIKIMLEQVNKMLEDKKKNSTNLLDELKDRILVTSRDLYEIRKIMGVEHCSYRTFMRKIEKGIVIYGHRYFPHKFNKRQWVRYFDITDHEEERMAYMILKQKKAKEKRNKITITLDTDTYEQLKAKAERENFTVEQLIQKILAVHTYRNFSKN
jgi:hypothetical protein